jgi:hypothetical protein
LSEAALKSTLHTVGAIGAILVGVLATNASFAQSCPADTSNVGQWVEHTSDADVTHVQCQQLSDAEIKKVADKMYPKTFIGTTPPTLPIGWDDRHPYKQAAPRHWVWDHAPATGHQSPSAMRDLVRGGGGGAAPGVP